MNDFMMIDNTFFNTDDNGQTIFNKIGTEGFTIYTYLLVIQDRDKRIRTTIKILHKQFSKTNKMKDIRTFKKFLIGLERNNYISCEDLNSKTKTNDGLIIEVNNPEYNNGFSKINTDILIKELNHITINGFAVFCMLFKYHNKNFGDGLQGYACCTEEYISKVLDIGVNQVRDSIYYLEKRKLIIVKNQEPIEVTNKYGDTEFTYLPNLYIVKPKIYPDHKYFIPLKENN